MWQVNVRGRYLCAYYALPHMLRGGWGHVVSCSPPIDEKANPGYVCYMTTKMGMTRLAIGIAAEYAAAKIGRPAQWRSPAILCDALLEIVTSEPAACTGRPGARM